MRLIIITLFVYILAAHAGFSQDRPEVAQDRKLEAMDRLEFMTGTWEGTGWIQMGAGERNSFDIHETIE